MTRAQPHNTTAMASIWLTLWVVSLLFGSLIGTVTAFVSNSPVTTTFGRKTTRLAIDGSHPENTIFGRQYRNLPLLVRLQASPNQNKETEATISTNKTDSSLIPALSTKPSPKTTSPSKAPTTPDPTEPDLHDPEAPRPQFPFGTIFERALDTIEDAVVHLRRKPYDFGWITESEIQKATRRKTVVVLGSGWAAHAFFKITDTYDWRIIVISPVNHFVFTPMLASAAVGTVEYRSMTEAVRAANPMIEEYVEGQAVDLDIEKKIVKVQLNDLLQDVTLTKPPLVEFEYDHLVVAVGCKVADSLVPGAKEYSLRLKTCDDARKLRNAVGECLEYASRPDVSTSPGKGGVTLAESEQVLRQQERRRRVTFAIVGGGPTGVELAGELSDLMQDITKPRVGAYPKLQKDIRIVLIHTGPDLVPQFDPALRKHALKTLEQAGVEVMLKTRVKEVGDGFIKVMTPDGKDETLPVGLTIWAAGTGPVPFVEKLLDKLPATARGQGAFGKIVVDKWLRCPTPTPETFGSILVMGDAAAFADGERNGRISYLPQTAQVAGQQGAFAARLMCRGYDLTVTPPIIPDDKKSQLLCAYLRARGLSEAKGFDFLNLGLLAYVGEGEALSQIQVGDVPILSYAGSISFVLWRSVYLVKQVATRNRVLVTFDWMKSTLFGRDITRL